MCIGILIYEVLRKRLADKPRPVSDGADEVAIVNEIKGVGCVKPVLLGIVDLEVAIWCHPMSCQKGHPLTSIGL